MGSSCSWLYLCVHSCTHLACDFGQITNSEKLEKFIVRRQTKFFAFHLDLPNNASEGYCTDRSSHKYDLALMGTILTENVC